ncbi:hypothetical protein GCM10009122_44610 [Fulvivirga kasyanovii]|uniref:Histidine kinase n=1 Tax=Fulvivirga kasyanovii TaxID=396812 RepID=A0ABW9RWT4_9BACT|nr:hypothetical protein [Fulvivirga kasyanovii]MTI27739.1 hypothetical protein [Fulvivirga kasyanovii]
MTLFGLIKFLELSSAIIGSIYYKKYSHTFLRYFLFLLWLITGVEFTMWFLKIYEVSIQNNFVYNLLTSVQYIYLLLLYHRTVKSKKYKLWILAFLIIFLISITINFVWLDKLMTTSAFSSYTFTMGAVFLIASIGLFLVEILNTEKVLYFQKYLMFWISAGLAFYYTAIIPYIISLNFLPAFRSTGTWTFIIFTLNLVMYGCFCVGFIVSKKLAD